MDEKEWPNTVAEMGAAVRPGIDEFNAAQREDLVSPEQAFKMTEDGQAISKDMGWEKVLNTKERLLLRSCRAFVEAPVPGCNLMLLVKKLAEIIDGVQYVAS